MQKLIGISVALLATVMLAGSVLATATPASYFVLSNNTGFYRSSTPWSSTSSGGDVSTEVVNSDGSVTMSINQVSSQYNDLGYYMYYGTVGSLTSVPIVGTGSFAVNLWFDTGGDGQIFAWNGNGKMTNLSGDSYILGGPDLHNAGSGVTISASSTFQSMQGGISVCTPSSPTLAQIQAGACTGITSSTPVWIWVGVGPITSGTVSADVETINGAPLVLSANQVFATVNTPAATCGISVSGGPLAFGTVPQGTSSGNVPVTVTNGGTVPTQSFTVWGTDWQGVSNTMPYSATSVYDTQWYTLPGPTSAQAGSLFGGSVQANGGSVTPYFKVTIPVSQPQDSYLQVITFNAGC